MRSPVGSGGRSEFSYGAFVRSVTLPAGADEDAIKASYYKGILTVTVPVIEQKATEKHVEIQSAAQSIAGPGVPDIPGQHPGWAGAKFRSTPPGLDHSVRLWASDSR